MAAVEFGKAESKKGEAKEEGVLDAMAEFAKLMSSRRRVHAPCATALPTGCRGTGLYQCRISTSLLERSVQVDHRYLNRVNVDNIKHIVSELFSENLIRGRGLFARSTMKAQAASLPFHSRLCGPRFDSQHKIAHAGQIVTSPVDQPVQKGI